MASRSKKKKLRRLTHNNLQKGALQPEYIYYQNPFSDIPAEERIKIFNEIFKNIEKELPNKFTQLKNFLLNTEPIHLLSLFSYYFLTSPIGKQKITSGKNEIKQFHVELLQSFILSFNENDYTDSSPISPFKIEELTVLLTTLTEYHSLLFLNDKLDSVTEDEKYISLILSQIKTHTFAVRNWAYPKETRQTLIKIFNPINELIFEETSINIISLIHLFAELTKEIEEKINSHRQKVIEVLKLNDKTQIIEKYFQFFSSKNTVEELLELSRKFKSRKDFKLFLLTHSDLFLPDYYKIDVQKYLNKYHSSFTQLEEVVKSLTYKIGDLSNEKIEHFYLDNPIWKKPFIEDFFGDIYYPIPSLFQHTNFQIIEYLLKDYPDLIKKIAKRRSIFLEEEIESIFNSAFPSAQVYKNILWSELTVNQLFENDLLVLLDNSVIIIEAKSAKFSAPAKRGAPLRLKDEINTFLIEPAIQTKRFAKFINNNKKVLTLKSKDGNVHSIDFSNVTRTIRLCITLDFVPVISSSKKDLFAAGLITDKNIIPTTLSLNDLAIVFELLETSSEKLHYLYRRSEIEENANLEGDELDFLTFYLETGFNIGDDEFSDQIMMLSGSSEKLDDYFIARDYSYEIIKPKPRRTKWWQDTLLKLEERKFLGWSEIAYIFQNVIYEDQIKIENAVRNQKRIVHNNWRLPNLKNSILLITGPSRRQNLIIWFLYKDIPKNERDEKVKAIVSKATDEYNFSKALVFGINIDKNHYPYSFIAILQVDDISSENSLKEI